MKPSRKFLGSVIFLCMGASSVHASGILTIGGGSSNISGGPSFAPLIVANNSSVLEADIVNALAVNPVVTVSNLGGGAINVISPVSWLNANTFTVNAATSLTVSANITNIVGNGTLNLFASNGSVALNGVVEISNALTVNATAGITQDNSHILKATGLGTFNAGSSNITLNGPDNNFGSLNLTGNSVSITEASSSLLAAVNVGSFSLISSGAITQTGSAQVAGAASFNAGTNAITLTNAANNFGSVSLNGTTVALNEQGDTDLGTVNATTLNITSGGAITNSGNVAVTGAATLSGTSINFGGGVGTATVGSLNFNSTGTASFNLLSGTSITGANTAGNFIWNTNGTGLLALGSTITATSAEIQQGSITFSANNQLVISGGLSLLSGATLNLGTFNNTVGTYSQTGAANLNGTGTLTATTYNLSGGNVNANLGTGTLNQVGNTTTFLNGTSAASAVNVNVGTLALGSSNRLNDSAAVTINGGRLNLQNFSDTVGTFAINTGTLDGAGTLTAATYGLNGGTVNANLGLGIINQTGGTTLLNGTASALTVNVNGGTLQLGASDRLANGAALTLNNGTLNLAAFNDTVASLILNGGTLNGTGTLTAATYGLNGGTINANLGAGILTQLSNTTTLNGTSLSVDVNINGGSLTLGAAERLNNSAALKIAGGSLNLAGFNETVSTFTINTGTLDGTGTLTAATYDLSGGAINANLGAGVLTQIVNTTLLNGTSAAATVNVNGGTLSLGADQRLLDSAAVTVSGVGILNLATFSDTVGSFTLNGGTLNGTGTLTAATYSLNGGNINGNLGAGTLNQLSNITVLNGTSAAATVNVIGGTLTLGSSDRLSDSAAVTVNSAILNLGVFNDTVGTFTLNAGTLNGTGTLTATTYDLNGGTVNANLGTGTVNQLTNTTTLNGTSAASIVNVTGGTLALGAADRLSDTAAVNVAAILNLGSFSESVGNFTLNGGTLSGSGTLTATTYNLNGGTVNANLGSGTLNQISNTTTLNGTSTASLVNVNGGTLTLGAANRLFDSAAVTVNVGTLNLGTFSDTVGTFLLNSGTLDGSGTLTATTYTLNGGTINANLGTGTVTQIGNTTTLNGTSAATTVNVNGGTLSLGAAERLANTAALSINSGILNLSSFSETVGTFTLTGGSLNGTGTLTAATYDLNGGTVNANLGAGILNQLSNTTTLNGTSAAAAVNVNGGTLTLGAADRLDNTAAVSINSGVLNLGTFNDTVGTFTLTGGSLNGTGTLTAATYALNGGTVNANLGAGILTQLTNTTLLNGTSAAATVNVNGGTLALGAANRLLDSAAVTIATGASLNLGTFNDTVGTFTLNGGTLDGTGTLTATTYSLNGGTVNGNLGAGILTQLSSTTLLNGTSSAATVNINGGTLTLGAANRLLDTAAVAINSGTLNLATFSDTVGTFTINGGILEGTGTLTAATYDLNGGTINANLGAGILNQLTNTTTLNGTSAAATVNINGGTLTLGASDRLLNSAAVTIASIGTLNLGAFNDTVGTFTINGGILDGTGTLTATTYSLNGGTVNANLGAGILNQLTNTTTLNGTSAAATVNVNGGTLTLGASDRLLNTAAVTIASLGTLNLGAFDDTVGTFKINGGILNGTGTLTASTYDLNGGTINANLGAGSLTQLTNTTTLNGTSAAATVSINGGTLTLGASDRLLNSAAVTIASLGTLNLEAFNDTVGTFTINGGILNGTGTLTAATYDLNGGTVNANLGAGILTQLSNTTTLNGTSAAATVNINGGTLTLGASDRLLDTAAVSIAINTTLNLGNFNDTVGSFSLHGGSLNGTGTLTAATYALNGGTVNANLGAGILNQLTNTTTLNGTSAAATVNVDGGTLALGASDRLANNAAVTINSGILNLATFNDTVGTFTLNGGILNGTGTLTAATCNLNGGTLNSNLGAGILNQLSNTTNLNGTSAAATVNINGGTLALGASDRLLNTAAVTIAGLGTLDLGTFNDTVGTFTLNGGILNGTGTLTASTYDLNGGTVNANLGAGTLNQLSTTTTLNGTSAAATVNINGGTLTLGATNRLLDTAALTINTGTLNLAGFNDTVGTFTFNGGILDGTGTLTAATYDLNGGTVNANLGAGILTQLTNTTTLNGTSAASTVNINGGTLALGASDRLLNTAAVAIASLGTLDLATFNDTVGTFTLNGGILNGTGTLTAATYSLNGGTLNGNLGDGILTQISNTTTLIGTSSAATVNINGGTLTLGASDRLLDTAVVTIASTGTLNLGTFNDTVGTFTLNGGILNGTGTLTATTYSLNGGTLNGNLGEGTLTQLTNTTTLNGTSNASIVNINGGTLALGASDRLSDTAAVTVSNGTLNIGAFNDTVGSFTLISGVLTGTGSLTATTYNLSGSTINTDLGTGTINQLANNTILNGTSAASAVNINGGTLTLGASERLSDTAALTVNSGTFDLQNFNETVGTFALNGGILNGTGTLTAATYDLSGGIVNALLGDGIINQLAGTTVLNGTSTAAAINVNGGTLTMGASDRFSNSAALVINGATLNLQGFSDTISTFTLNGGTLKGTGILTASTYDLKGGTLNAKLGTGALNQLSGTTLLNGTTASLDINITGGSLALGASGNLANNATVTVTAPGSLNMGIHSDVIEELILNGGTINGTGTLTATDYTFNGGTVNAKLGTGVITQLSNTTTLNGSAGATEINIDGGTLALGASARLSVNAAVRLNAGTFALGTFSDTVGQFTLNGGTLSGTGTLTAATYSLYGGNIDANLGTGTLTQLDGITTLTGRASAGNVSINGGKLVLAASNRLADEAEISINNATIDLGTFNDTVGTFTLNGGSLDGTGTLTAADYTFNGGTVNANLGTGILTQATGVSILNGSSAAAQVRIVGGTLSLGASERLSDTSEVSLIRAELNLGSSDETISTFTSRGGLLSGTGTLTATSYLLKGGTLVGNLGEGFINQIDGVTELVGTTATRRVRIAGGTLKLGASDRIVDNANLRVVDIGVFDTGKFDERVTNYFQSNQGKLSGNGELVVSNRATITGGNIAGVLLGDIEIKGSSKITGRVGGGDLVVNNGDLTLTGIAESNTRVSANGALLGTGSIDGNLKNFGNLAVDAGGKSKDLSISGNLLNKGEVTLSLKNKNTFESINTQSVQFGGKLIVVNTGKGLNVGDSVKLFDSGSYAKAFKSIVAVGFEGKIVFNKETGELVRLPTGRGIEGRQLATMVDNLPSSKSSQAAAAKVKEDKKLIAANTPASGRTSKSAAVSSFARNQAKSLATPASMVAPLLPAAPVPNLKSPEVHRSLADYTEQSLRSHVRDAMEQAPTSRVGDTEAFATTSYHSSGVDGNATNAGYDINSFGATLGARHDLSKLAQIGGFFGYDDGKIEGNLVDTDASGFTLGAFGRYTIHESTKTQLIASATYGNYDYDITRHSAGGDVHANGVNSDAVELTLGMTSVVYEKDGFRVTPSVMFRYLTGEVDGFTESGPGTTLAVGSQDINSPLLDLGIDFEYAVQPKLTLVGHLGYIVDFDSDSETIKATNTAKGGAFSVNAPGIDNEAFVLGAGAYYDLSDSLRIGLTYRGEFRSSDSASSQNIGIGASLSF